MNGSLLCFVGFKDLIPAITNKSINCKVKTSNSFVIFLIEIRAIYFDVVKCF